MPSFTVGCGTARALAPWGLEPAQRRALRQGRGGIETAPAKSGRPALLRASLSRSVAGHDLDRQTAL